MRTIIGLEVHAQLLTRTKLFCGCSADYFAKPPNTNTCPVCLGMPGALPVLNKQAVDYAIKTALALNCRIPQRSKFDRKNYFYPDLPKGYQISQYDEPLAVNGYLELELAGKIKRISIRRVHLEEDAGKLIHEEGGSLVDFNRSGVPLVEIVTEPDISSPAEARAFMEELRRILRYSGVCNGDMEKGSLRCDANISLSLQHGRLGTKTEVKNMNSFKAIEEALKFAEERQKSILFAGGKIEQETLGWNADTGRAEVMRTKEEAEDYRYFPEPDLVPLEIDEQWKNKIMEEMIELPEKKRSRFKEQYKLPDYDIRILTEEKALADYFESVLEAAVGERLQQYYKFQGRQPFSKGPHPKSKWPKEVSNWMMTELLRLIKGGGVEEISLKPSDFAQILKMIDEGKINRNTGKEIIEEAFKTGKSPETIVAEKGLAKISDESLLEEIADRVIAENPGPVAELRAGKEQILSFLLGQMMKKTKGKADPQKAKEILSKKLA